MSDLEKPINEVTSLLEKGLKKVDTMHHLEAGLQLRSSNCGLATATLQLYLQELYDIPTERLLAVPPKAPRGLNSRRMAHVVLCHEGTIIDPTYSQFLGYVGLQAFRVSEHGSLQQLWPEAKIAYIDQSKTDQFADNLASYAHKIAPTIHDIRGDEVRYTPDSALSNKSFAEKRDIYRDIWSANNYAPIELDQQPAHIRSDANKIVQLIESSGQK